MVDECRGEVDSGLGVVGIRGTVKGVGEVRGAGPEMEDVWFALGLGLGLRSRLNGMAL